MAAARICIDGDGTIVAVDAAFCTLMRGTADALIGTGALAITAPADREACVALFDRLRRDGMPLTTTKRLIRHDGSHVWVRNALERARDGDDGQPRYAITIARATPPAEWIDPARLLDLARLLIASRRQRGAMFDPRLFADHAWDILLSAYVAEAEGHACSIADLHAGSGIALATVSRWLRALHAQDLIVYEGRGNPHLITSPIRLSAAGHDRFEGYLSALHRSLAPAEVLSD